MYCELCGVARYVFGPSGFSITKSWVVEEKQNTRFFTRSLLSSDEENKLFRIICCYLVSEKVSAFFSTREKMVFQLAGDFPSRRHHHVYVR